MSLDSVRGKPMEGKGSNLLPPIWFRRKLSGGGGSEPCGTHQTPHKKSGPISGATLEKRQLRKVSGKAIVSPDQPAGVAQREVMSSAASEGDWFGGLFHCLKEGAFAAPKKASSGAFASGAPTRCPASTSTTSGRTGPRPEAHVEGQKTAGSCTFRAGT